MEGSLRRAHSNDGGWGPCEIAQAGSLSAHSRLFILAGCRISDSQWGLYKGHVLHMLLG